MNKVWYRNKAYWISIVAVLVGFTLISDVVVFHTAKAVYHSVGSSELTFAHNNDRPAKAKGTVKLTYHSYKYAQKKTYQINQDENSWDHADVKINSVTIYKLVKNYKEVGLDVKTGNCIMLINMTVKANQDVNIYPTQGTISTNNGLQANVMMGDDDFDGAIDGGVSKTGDAVVVFNNVNKIADIKKLRFKFDGFSKSDDDASSKNYDFSIKLH